MKIRKLYVKTVYKIFNNRLLFETLYPELLNDLDDREKRRLINLVNQFFRHYHHCEEILLNKVEKKIEGTPLKTQIILIAAACEYFLLDKSVDYAVVNDYVEISKHFAGPHATGFVNAILRKLTSLPKDELFNTEQDILLSHPDWVKDMWKADFGWENTLKMMRFNQQIPGLFLRVNRLKNSVAKLTEKLAAEEIITEPVAGFADFLLVKSGNPFASAGWTDGSFYIQEPSHALPALLLDAKKGMKVLDLCCAPGGKATYLQELNANKVKLYLNDISQKKRVMIKQNFKRLGLSFDKLTFQEAEKFQEYMEFDRIMIDAPCTGSGNFQRHPESRWNKEQEQLADLVKLQSKILENAKIYVVKGGVIVYSTCSLFKKENEEIIEKFLESNPDYQLQDFPDNSYADYKISTGLYRVNPAIHQLAGSFAARIVRIR